MIVHNPHKLHPEFDLVEARRIFTESGHNKDIDGELITSPHDLFSVEELRDRLELRIGDAVPTRRVELKRGNAVRTLGSLLRNIARLNGAETRDRATATRSGARLAQLPESVVTDILSLERPSAMTTTDAARLFPEYLAAVEQLARFVDTWRG